MSKILETASHVGSRVSEFTEKAGDLSRAAGQKLDGVRNDTAAALQSAASSIRSTGRQGCEKIEDLTSGVADKLDATGSYIQEHDMKKVRAKVRRFVGRNGILLAATAFVAGFALRQMTHSCADGQEHHSAR